MRAILTGMFYLLISVSAIAGDATQHTVEVDDHFKLGILYELAISPDGDRVAYTEGRWQEATNDRQTDIWLVSVEGKQVQRLTSDRGGYDSLRWSPDGQFLYFASQVKQPEQTAPPYNDTRQVWRLKLDNLAREPVTRHSGGIEAYDLAADGEWIVYTSSSENDEGKWQKQRNDFSTIRYGTRKRAVTSISKVDLASWRTTEVAQYPGAVDAFRLSPDGQRLAMVTAPDSSVISMEGKSELTVLELANGKAFDLPDDQWRKELGSPYCRVGQPEWASDSRAFAFPVGFDAYPSELFVATWEGDPATPKISKIKRPGTVSLYGGVDGDSVVAWRGKTRDLCFLCDDKARMKIYCQKNASNDDEAAVDITPGDVIIDQFAWDQAGKRAAAIYGKPDAMHDIYVLVDGVWTQLTEINAHAKDWALPDISIVSWKGAGGETVEGVLELPPDYSTGTRLPLIVHLHGGPTAAWPSKLQLGFTGSVLFASQGYAFFSPNYRGSTGYGDKFITDLIGHENEIEVEDILLGVDMLVEKGIADPDRIGVAGWSNGGYLTNCLIAKSDRFKAASSGAGIVEQTLEWGVSDEPAYPTVFLGGTPWSAPDAYRRASPIFDFRKVKTPTLFHVGELDPRCPKGHSEMAFRALNDFLSVDSELLIYPEEEHGLNKLDSRRAKMAWELAWFDHYLKGKPIPSADQ